MKQVVNYNKLKKERLIISWKKTQLLKRRNFHSQNKKISMPLHTLNKIMNECQLYQCIATQGMIYQISSEQSDVKGQKFFQYEKTMIKDSNGTIEIQIFGKKLYSLLEEKKCINVIPQSNTYD